MYSLAKADPPKSYMHCQQGFSQLGFGGVRNTYSEGTRSVTGSSPTCTTVKTHTLIRDDLDETAAAEGLGVGLTFDLQDVQGQENDLTDTDQARDMLEFGKPRRVPCNLTCRQRRA